MREVETHKNIFSMEPQSRNEPLRTTEMRVKKTENVTVKVTKFVRRIDRILREFF